MTDKDRIPRYAVRLVILFVSAVALFFVGLQFFVPEGSRLTGSYDAKSLLYIASAPIAYAGSESCGTANCHEDLFKKWSTGAHGAREEQSKCEACHGPQGDHPEKIMKLPTTRGDGNLVELCLTCHRKMKARSTTQQPQISPQEHPFPHEGVLICTQCHDPHSPGLKAAVESKKDNVAGESKKSGGINGASIASGCFSCHGPSGRGGFAPALAGQSYEVLKTKLTNYKTGKTKSPMMSPVVSDLKDKEIDALANYFAELQ